MRRFYRSDVTRQAANVAGAVFQVVAAALAGPQIGRAAQENETLLLPAGYAFAIWTPIFALSLAYALYAAFPVNRDDPLLRRVGWFTAAAFVLGGVWEIVFPAGRLILAQAVLLGVFAASGVAYLIAQRQIAAARANEPLSGRWLTAPTTGLLFGWVSAATLVGFSATLSGVGVLGGTGGTFVGETFVGGALLVLGGILASGALIAGRRGPVLGYLAYGAAFLWALAAVAVNRYDDSAPITALALLAAAPVAVILAGALREARSRRLRPRTRTVR